MLFGVGDMSSWYADDGGYEDDFVYDPAWTTLSPRKFYSRKEKMEYAREQAALDLFDDELSEDLN